jgi:hypothetical protein
MKMKIKRGDNVICEKLDKNDHNCLKCQHGKIHSYTGYHCRDEGPCGVCIPDPIKKLRKQKLKILQKINESTL